MSVDGGFEERSIATRWTDFDTAGHVTDAAYPIFFGNARGAFLTARVGSFDQWPCVLARVEIDYRNEIPYPNDSVLVRTRIDEVGRRSVTFAQELVRADGVVAAVSRSVLVAWNTSERASRDIDDDSRARLVG
jgi:acyl-CoA thioester hydrolase